MSSVTDENAADEDTADEDTAGKDRLGGRRADPYILLVEDNPTDEALTCRVLRKTRVLKDIVVTRDGAEALDFLFARGRYSGRTAEHLPHLVLLDLNLPKLGGIEVLREVRGHELTRCLPVVILTSSSEDVDLMAGYQSGANSYVVKPVEFADFHEVVRQLGLYWMFVNHQPLDWGNPPRVGAAEQLDAGQPDAGQPRADQSAPIRGRRSERADQSASVTGAPGSGHRS